MDRIDAIIDWIRREPVRVFTAATVAIPALLTGLRLFFGYEPTPEQYDYLIALPAVIAAMVGWTAVRNAVASRSNIEAENAVTAFKLWNPRVDDDRVDADRGAIDLQYALVCTACILVIVYIAVQLL